MKKAQGLSLQTIIIAAVVLIVLIVSWSIFTGRISQTSKELSSCRGRCVKEGTCGAVDPQGECLGTTSLTNAQGANVRTLGQDKECCILKNV